MSDGAFEAGRGGAGAFEYPVDGIPLLTLRSDIWGVVLIGRELSPLGIMVGVTAGPVPALPSEVGATCWAGGRTLCFRAWAANIRSASSPCLSPLPSFL